MMGAPNAAPVYDGQYAEELRATAAAMVAPGKGLDEMFMPGSINISDDVEHQPKMEGLAPS